MSPRVEWPISRLQPTPVEVIQLTPTGDDAKAGTYAMRLFPEAIPVRRTKNGVTQEQTHLANQDPVLNGSSLVRQVSDKAPRVTLLENHCFIDRGVWQVKKLRRGQIVELTPWITLVSLCSAPSEPQFVKRDRLSQARLYQSLLDSGLAKSRAEVARYFGVSRARVTQVLQRLER